MYAASYGNNLIAKYDSTGRYTIFAKSGLDGPTFIATQIPEPATSVLVAVAVSTLLSKSARRRYW